MNSMMNSHFETSPSLTTAWYYSCSMDAAWVKKAIESGQLLAPSSLPELGKPEKIVELLKEYHK